MCPHGHGHVSTNSFLRTHLLCKSGSSLNFANHPPWERWGGSGWVMVLLEIHIVRHMIDTQLIWLYISSLYPTITHIHSHIGSISVKIDSQLPVHTNICRCSNLSYKLVQYYAQFGNTYNKMVQYLHITHAQPPDYFILFLGYL